MFKDNKWTSTQSQWTLGADLLLGSSISQAYKSGYGRHRNEVDIKKLLNHLKFVFSGNSSSSSSVSVNVDENQPGPVNGDQPELLNVPENEAEEMEMESKSTNIPQNL